MNTALTYTEQKFKEITECLNYLRELVSQPEDGEREVLLQGTLWHLASAITGTVADWAHPRPRLPLPAVMAWAEARRIVMAQADDFGVDQWQSAKKELKALLHAGYEMEKAEVF